MSKVRVNAFGIAVDGYGAGPDQDLDNPMGVGGMALHQWVFGTRTFQKMHADFAGSLIGDEVAREGVDDDFAARGFENLGAWIMGRNMFGPVRGPWPDDSWRGWWGTNPPYHVPVFVLTHHARAPITMEGGTTFHFVTDGIHAALNRAKEAAHGQDVRLGGGVATIRRADRRDPPRDLPRASGQGRAPPCRHRYGEPWLQVHGARLHGPRHPCRPDEVGPST
jgi:dihydrofolate reductase